MVVGLDEVGRGAWAGPLVVGAAVVSQKKRRLKGVRDSKQIAEKEREALFDPLGAWCAHWATGQASAAECDELGMSRAQRLAAGRALEALGVVPDAVLLDGRWDFVGHERTTMVVGGDAKCVSIAAASVLAKVTRDRMMRAQAEIFPPYDFGANKGYPSPKHRAALASVGASPIHRQSWSFMDGVAAKTGLGSIEICQSRH